jgi:hypothetical protein
MTKEIAAVDNALIKSKIILINDKPVILDRDVAEIYGVETKELNQAVSRNKDKFPERYLIEVGDKEKNELVTNCDRFASLKHSTARPKCFTEQGLYMIATILKSKRAKDVTMQIIDTFTEFRQIAKSLDSAGNAKNNKSLGDYLATAATKLGNLLIKNMEADSNTVKTTLELNLGIARAKIETTQSEEKKRKK